MTSIRMQGAKVNLLVFPLKCEKTCATDCKQFFFIFLHVLGQNIKRMIEHAKKCGQSVGTCRLRMANAMSHQDVIMERDSADPTWSNLNIPQLLWPGAKVKSKSLAEEMLLLPGLFRCGYSASRVTAVRIKVWPCLGFRSSFMFLLPCQAFLGANLGLCFCTV